MINQFSKVIPRDKSESYFKHQYFTFKKIVEYNEALDAIKITITPAYDEEVIYYMNVMDITYCYDIQYEIQDALNEWIEENTSEQEKIFVMLKEM